MNITKPKHLIGERTPPECGFRPPAEKLRGA
jgi:hypothetical protein